LILVFMVAGNETDVGMVKLEMVALLPQMLDDHVLLCVAPVDVILGAPVITPVLLNTVLPPTVMDVGTIRLEMVALLLHVLDDQVLLCVAPVDVTLGAPVIAPVLLNTVLPPTVMEVGTVKLQMVALLLYVLLWVAEVDVTLETPEITPVVPMVSNVGIVRLETVAFDAYMVLTVATPETYMLVLDKVATVAVGTLDMLPCPSNICVAAPNIPSEILDETSGPVTVQLLLTCRLLGALLPLPTKKFWLGSGEKIRTSFDVAPGNTWAFELQSFK